MAEEPLPSTTDEKKISLPARSTRGTRMTSMVTDEADEAFWGQEFFKDEANDNEYESEEAEEDVVDADFYDPENEIVEPLSDNEKKGDDEEKKKRKNVYVDPQGRDAKKQKSGGKVRGKGGKKKDSTETTTTTTTTTTEVKAQPKSPATPGAKEKKALPQSDRVMRVSTLDKTAETADKRVHDQKKKAKKQIERAKRKSGRRHKQLTQEELLEEAKYTEEYNRASLEYLTRMEEEKKKIAITSRAQLKGPLIRFLSKDGVNTITFTNVDAVPDFINAKAEPYPPKAICQITGQPAKYLDPSTLTPYATIDAFKVIKQKNLQKQETQINAQISKLEAMLEEKRKKKGELKQANKRRQ